MDPFAIINRYYPKGSKAWHILVDHGKQVARKALESAMKVTDLNPDLEFIEQAAILHDIGIYNTNSPALGCTGQHPYILHGVLGRKILEQNGLPKHALVCERHVGVGLTIRDIHEESLQLPIREMVPVTIEEKLICYADKFFSKNNTGETRGKTIRAITRSLKPYGDDKVKRFLSWHNRFHTNTGHSNT